MNIRDALKKITEKDGLFTVVGQVTKVDKQNKVCVVEPLNGDPEIFGVRYCPTESDSVGLILHPKVDSFVLVGFLDEENAFIALTTEFETIEVKNQSADLKQILLDTMAAIKTLTVPTPAGQSSTPINVQSFIQIEQQINKLFE